MSALDKADGRPEPSLCPCWGGGGEDGTWKAGYLKLEALGNQQVLDKASLGCPHLPKDQTCQQENNQSPLLPSPRAH